jgi:hypothetical protein
LSGFGSSAFRFVPDTDFLRRCINEKTCPSRFQMHYSILACKRAVEIT